MPYKLVVPEGYRRRGGAGPRNAGGTRHYTRAQRLRILEVLRLQCNDAPPRVPGPEARRRVVEVLRLQAGIPADSSEVRLPRGRPEPMDISDLENEWEEGQRRYRGHLAVLGLSQDMYGRLHCAACGDFVPASTRGMNCGSLKALALWHGQFCTAVEREE
jgi:hypothetical protein